MYPNEHDVAIFDRQMKLLATCFNVLPLAEALEKLEAGSLPPRSVCITFDDGYADNYTNAFPILKKWNLHATFFIVSDIIDKPRLWNDNVVEAVRGYTGSQLDLRSLNLDSYAVSTPREKYLAADAIIKAIKYLPFAERARICEEISCLAAFLPTDLMLTTEQVQTLCHSGMGVGSHSVSHPILAGLTTAAWQNEIIKSKIDLEALTAQPIKFFAFPNGKFNKDFTQEQCDFLRTCGYNAGLSADRGYATASSDKWRLLRYYPSEATPEGFLMGLLKLFAYH